MLGSFFNSQPEAVNSGAVLVAESHMRDYQKLERMGYFSQLALRALDVERFNRMRQNWSAVDFALSLGRPVQIVDDNPVPAWQRPLANLLGR